MQNCAVDILSHLLITVDHLKRSAIIYVRRSTPEDGGSQALHENQVQLARAYGWPSHLIEVIDELKSSTTSVKAAASP